MEREEAEIQSPAGQGQGRRRRLGELEARIVAAGLLMRVAYKAAKDPGPWNKDQEMSNIIGALNAGCATAALGLASASLLLVLFGRRWENNESSSRHDVLLLISMFLLSCCLGMLSAEEPLGMFFVSAGVWISAAAAALLVRHYRRRSA